jgi:hypothetical protein
MAPRTAVAVAPKAKINLPANIAQQLQAEALSIQNRIGQPSGNRISTTKKQTFKLPNGQEVPAPLEAVIVDFVSLNLYYESGYDPNNITPPVCAAVGTEVGSMEPFKDAYDRQCDTCSACPMNQWGSDPKGGKGKACSNTRLLALLPTDADSETPLMTLRVSATALKSFDGYVSSVVRSFGAPPVVVVTDITFDDNLDYPSLRFGNPRPCPDDLLKLAFSRRGEAQEILNTKPDFDALRAAAAAAPAKKVAPRRGR